MKGHLSKIIAVVVMVLAGFAQSCLPPSAEQAELVRQAVAAVDAVKQADARVTEIRARIKALSEALQAGSDDPAVERELLALVAELPGALQQAANLTGQMKEAAAAVKAAQGMDWKGWILPGLTLLLGVGGIYFPLLKPAQVALAAATGQRQACILGTEKYRLAPDDDPREIEDFIADEALRLGVADGLRAEVKALTGSTAKAAAESPTKSVAPHV